MKIRDFLHEYTYSQQNRLRRSEWIEMPAQSQEFRMSEGSCTKFLYDRSDFGQWRMIRLFYRSHLPSLSHPAPRLPYAIYFPVYLLQSRQVRTRYARNPFGIAPALCNANSRSRTACGARNVWAACVRHAFVAAVRASFFLSEKTFPPSTRSDKHPAAPSL